MKRQLAFAWLASGLALMVIPFTIVLKSRVSASNSKTKPPTYELARLGDRATVHAAGPGAPRMNLADGREVLTAYAGDPEAQRLLQQNLVQPLAMASSDFDEDGMPDLISAYAGPNGGVITLHRGNVDAMFPESPDAKQRKARGEFTDAPFLSPAGVFRLSESPDFIGAGDFNADGHFDVIFAARGGNSLYLLPGDGKGGFGSPVSVPLPGRVTTMVSGEINRRDGPSAVAVGVAGADGARLLLFESSRGIASPETIALPAEANAVAIGHFDDDFESEVAVAAGNSLMIVPVRPARTGGKSPRISKRSFPFSIQSLATGDFTGNHSADLALLSGDGEVVVLSRPLKLSSAPIKDWSSQLLSRVRLQPVTQLIAARVSSLPLDTIVVVNSTEHQLRLLTNNTAASTDVGASTTDAALDAEAEPVAALPMRLNGDALGDLVVLTKGRGAPTVIIAAPSATFTVTNTGDISVGSLRDAINQANSTPGSLINFNLGAGTPTINVGSTTGLPLPFVSGATTTIDGNTGGSTRVELNGSLAGAGADGLTILSAGNTVRGLVINRFSGSGINLKQGDGNFIQGNFIGTNAAGTAALPNASGGVVVSSASNTIGGTTAAARNVISGNGSFGLAVGGALGSNNFVRGNFIGTDATGALPLANNGAGVGISGSNNTVGGTLAGASNVIDFNTAVGVDVGAGTGNAILSNSIFSNGGLGINLSDDVGAVTPNDPNPPGCPADTDTGANNLQNFPVLTSASSAGGNTTVAGMLNSTPLTAFRIEFFSNNSGDPSGNGEGQTFIGSTNVMTASDCGATFNVILPVPVPAGNVVTATATDPSNNTSEFSAWVTVLAGCSITCPANQTRGNDPNQCGAVVTYPPPTTAGPCGLTVTCAPASGAFFPKGTTVVTCNTIAGPSCAFNVTVNDTQPPTITCPANVTRSTDPNLCSAVVSYAAPTVSDNCPGATSACAPPSGSNFAKGTTTVNCTATDAANNTATCSFTVTVTDKQPPTITCPPNQTAGANAPSVVNYPPPTVADNCPGATAACAPPSGSIFVLGTTPVMCTATDASANTATCTFTVTVASCVIACQPDVTSNTGSNGTLCGSNVTYAGPNASAACGPVTCAPASGSFFAVGTTKVTCTTQAGSSCSFTVTVVDSTPPRVTCPATIITPTSPGQSSALVNYPPATLSDNCPGASVQCSPPSGTRFPLGTTFVNCTGTDSSSNSAGCVFSIIVVDTEPPVIRCPANVSVVPPTGQTSAVVNYPPPTVTDNLPGASVVCSPASGSSFPLGVTTVTCTATDAAGNRSNCSFTVAVGGPQIKVTIPGNKTAVEFATVSPARKPPKPKNNPCSLFTVENIGFAPLVLTLDSISRTGSDVDNKRIADPNDARFFSVSLVNSDQSLTLLDIGAFLTLQPGQLQPLCARFAALIPGLAGKTTGLAASDVLPDIVTSTIIFRQNAGANIAIPVLARVATGVVLIDPTNPRRLPVVGFTRSGNDITVSYAVFDSNLNVSRAKYEFFDANGQVVAGPFEIDLTEPVRSLNLVKGQSFSVEQRFTGASSNPQVTGVRVTVFDGETSAVGSSTAAATPISASSIQLIKRAQGVTLYLPDVKLGPLLP